MEKPALDPASIADVTQVLESNPDFDPETCGVFHFAGLFFQHRLFTGRGSFLLRWLRIPMTRDGYHRLLGRLYPEAAANRILAQDAERHEDAWCSEDLQYFLAAFHNPALEGLPEESFASTWRAPLGVPLDRPESSEDRCVVRQQWNLVLSLLPRLTSRQRETLIGYYGLVEESPKTYDELAMDAEISTGRASQLGNAAVEKLRGLAEVERQRELALLPTSEVICDVIGRRADAEARRARYLDELFDRQDPVWKRAKQRLASRSTRDHEWARIELADLRVAANKRGTAIAFEARLAMLRTSTSGNRSFWTQWARATRRGDRLEFRRC